MHKITIGLLTLLLVNRVFSQAESNDLQLNTITTALPFMAITPDSRAGGMGEAGTALSPSATSVYWNTSMLSFAEKSSEISLSYTPWLRQLTNDMHLSYLSGYVRVNKKHTIAGAMRYFSLGEITFTDASGNVLRDDKPNEFELTGGYAFKLSEKFSVGVNGKFAYSNLTGGLTVAGVMTKPGMVGAADLSFTYFKDRVKIGKTNGIYTFAATINNIGNKVAYSVLAKRDFIPMNLKIGNAFQAKYDAYNTVTYSLDIQRLLVPTPALYDNVNGQVVMLSGRSNDVGVINGMLQSFYDAPGVVAKDENGDYIQNDDGTYEIVKGSRFKEEITEINIAGGVEWWYNETFAIRSGVFYENRNKGNRQYLNLGASLKYNMFSIDFSYLASLNGRQNPLANTLRFTLRLHLGDRPVKSTE
ncbi:MAG: type IX secretion system outer membrane channel protein PorV [Bacteroidetes bacterium]|nr:type IX secretion system outer membrane channel protein PorV [Bacteroidota bacterium]MBM3424215.1 type IX secretion system outer membrane channel protein PorV [Bacteroidota bacterium]